MASISAYDRAQKDAAYLARRAEFLPYVQAAAAKYGVPIELADMVIANESGYRQIKGTVPSTSGAAPQEFGFAQLMPATARRMGLRVDAQVDERQDPAKQADAALKYLGINYKLAGGDWGRTAQGYNAGEGRVNTPFNQLAPVTQSYATYLKEGQRRYAGGTLTMGESPSRPAPAPVAPAPSIAMPQSYATYLKEGQRRYAGGTLTMGESPSRPAPAPVAPAPSIAMPQNYFTGNSGYFSPQEAAPRPRVEAPIVPQYMPDERPAPQQVVLGGPIQAYLRQLGFT